MTPSPVDHDGPSSEEHALDRIALHTRLRADAVERYEDIHRVIPAALDAALRAAGVRHWRIWRDGCDLFHVVDCDDAGEMWDRLAADPANAAWQARIGPLLELDVDHGGGTALRQVWSLPADPAR